MIRSPNPQPSRNRVFEAIRASWCAETSCDPATWSSDNPAGQQCDVSAFIAWEYLGGDLVLGQVFVDGEQTEHHYWNRIAGDDIDLTRDQFSGDEEIREVDVLTTSFLRANADAIKPEVLERIAIMRNKVTANLET